MLTSRIPKFFRKSSQKPAGSIQSGRKQRNLYHPRYIILILALLLVSKSAWAQGTSVPLLDQLQNLLCKFIDLMGFLQYFSASAVIAGLFIVGGLAAANRFNYQKFGNMVLGGCCLGLAPGIIRFFLGERFEACVGSNLPARYIPTTFLEGISEPIAQISQILPYLG